METTFYKTGQLAILAIMVCSLWLRPLVVYGYSHTDTSEPQTKDLVNTSSSDYRGSEAEGINHEGRSTDESSAPHAVMPPGSIDIEDPCTCLNNETVSTGNGQFSETVTIQGIVGETWTIVEVEGFFQPGTSVPANPADAYLPGMSFQIDPDDASIYILAGIHVDGIGYAISATNGTDTLSIANQCFYPDPEINLGINYCVNFPPFALEVSDENHTGTFMAMINGAPATTFDAGSLGPGVHAVFYTFTAEPSGDAFPGCTVSRTVFVEVFEDYTGTLSCYAQLFAGLGQDGTFTVTPEVLLSDDFGCSSTFEVNIMGKDDNVLTCEDANIPWVAMVSDPIRGGGCTSVITVEDKLPPVFVCEDVTIACTEDIFSIPPDEHIEVTDNCEVTSLALIHQSSIDNPNCNPDYTAAITRTLRATDQMGNSSTCVQTVFLGRPDINEVEFPDNIEINGCAGQEDISPEVLGRPTLDGEPVGLFCELFTTYSDMVFPKCEGSEVIKRMWTVMDHCGAGSRQFVQEIAIKDMEPPVIDCPPALTLDTDPGQCSATFTVERPTVTDNCVPEDRISMLILVNNIPRTPGAEVQLELGSNIIEFIVNDPCLNYSTCIQTIEVEDNENPTLVCVPTTASLNESGEVAIVAQDLINNSYFDNCAIADTLLAKMDDPDNLQPSLIYDCSELGDNQLIVQVTDEAGNTNACMMTLTIQDKLPPVITSCPADITVDCTDNENNPIDVSFTGMAEATDNCEVESITFEDTPLNDDPCELIISRLFIASDASGNTATCTQIITVIDETPPTITMEAMDITVECDGSGNEADLNSWLNTIGGGEAIDACSDVIWTNDYNPDNFIDDCGATGSVSVVFTASDECGNTSTTSATFIIEDNAPAVFTVEAQDVTVECDGSGNTAELMTWVQNQGNAIATDACSDIVWSDDFDPNNFVANCGATGSVTVIFTATDECDNSSSSTATFTILDTSSPDIIVSAQNETVECDGAGNTAALQAWLDALAGAQASDICSDVIWTNDHDPANFIGACGETGSVTVIFTATDDCGNTSTTAATFTIEDTTSPEILVQAEDETVECDGEGNTADLQAWLDAQAGAEAVDNCSDVTWTNDYNPANFIGACGETGSVTVVFTATDDCGNTNTTSATFTIEDTTSPDITVSAQNEVVECDGSGNTTELQDWLDSQGGAQAEDDCSDVEWTNDYDPNNFIGGCGATGSVTVTFTVTDDCGNTDITSATFTIEDTTAPEIINCNDASFLLSQIESCDTDFLLNPALYELSTIDNCDDNVTIGEGVLSGFTDFCEDDLNPGLASGTVTFTVSDACGNESQCLVNVDITNDIPPNLDCPDTFELILDGDSGTGTLSASDLVTPEIPVSGCFNGEEFELVITGQTDFDCSDIGMPISVDVSASICGSPGATCTIDIIVIDPESILAVCPPDITIFCGDDINSAIDDHLLLFDEDGHCVESANTTFEVNVNDCPTGQVDFVHTVFSISGAESVCTSTIFVEVHPDDQFTEDDITFPDDFSTNCLVTQFPVTPQFAGGPDLPGFMPCQEIVDLNVDEVLVENDGGCRLIERTWIITDNCTGNVFTETQLINIAIENVQVPSGVTVANDPGLCGAMISLDPLFVPNCTGDVDITNDFNGGGADASGFYPVGTTTVTFTVTNGCPDTPDFYQIDITVVDTQSPVVSCSQNITISCSDDLDAALAGMTFSATDNCPDLLLDTTLNFNLDNCGMGAIGVVFSAMDQSNNAGSCSRTITVLPNPDFELSLSQFDLPADITLSCGESTDTDQTGLPSPSSVLLCADLDISFEDQLSDDEPEEGCSTITRTFTIEDNCTSSIQTYEQLIVISSATPVIVSGPADITVGNDSNECGANVSIDPLQLPACASDLTVVNNYNGLSDASDFYPVGETEVIFTVTNNCGNTTQWTINITVEDTEAPVVTCPSDVSVSCLEDIDAFILDLDYQATDNCEIDLTQINYDLSGIECGDGIVEVTFAAVDIHGNDASCSFNVTVLPTYLLLEQITWPEDITLTCSDDELDTDVTGVPVFEAFCGSPVASFEDFAVTTDSDGCASFERAWTVEDNCSGSEFMFIQTIEVPEYGDISDLDPEPILLVLEKDTDECGAQATVNFPVPTFCASDVSISNDFSEGGSDASGFYPVGTTVVNYTIENDCEVLFTSMAVIEVIDLNAPILDCPIQTQPVSCADDLDQIVANWGIVIDEPCPVDTTITYTFDLDNCGQGTVDFLFLVTDNSMNTATCSRTITIDADIESFDLNDVIWPESPLVIEDCTADIDPVVLGSEPQLLSPYLCLSPLIVFEDEEVDPTDDPDQFCAQFVRSWSVISACSGDTLAAFDQTIFLQPEGQGIVIDGFIKTEYGEGVHGVVVSANDSRNSRNSMSGALGFYQLSTHITPSGLLIKPSKEDGESLNITAADILSIMRHIRGVQRLDSPYKMIAADVNRDGRITAQDIVILRGVILNRIEDLPFGSWRFIDADYTFDDEAQPLKEAFAEDAFIPYTSDKSVNKDFIAVHLGDVFNSANGLVNRSSSHHPIRVDDFSFNDGEDIDLTVSIDDFDKVESCQFALTFDHSILRLESIQVSEDIHASQINLDKLDEGVIMIAWDYLSGNTFSSPDIMNLSFKTLSSGSTRQILNISKHIIKPEITMSNHADFRIPVLEYVNRSSESVKGFELFQNEPNPFDNFTKIPFYLPDAEDVELTIYDLNGTVVHFEKVWFDRGYQSFILNNLLYGLPEGTYFYRVKTNDYSATKKMIRTTSY